MRDTHSWATENGPLMMCWAKGCIRLIHWGEVIDIPEEIWTDLALKCDEEMAKAKKRREQYIHEHPAC